MDPNACLNELRALNERVRDGVAEPWQVERLAELFEALDEWLSKGGFTPEAWKPPQVPRGPYGPFTP